MSLLIAMLLGLVQGLTEFIPVSSSGHLVLAPYLLGIQPPGLAFDVALHLGTALAVIVTFRAELWAMACGVLGVRRGPDARLYRRLGVLIIVGSVPVAVVGLLLKSTFEEAFASPVAASVFLFVTAAILIGGERLRDRRVAQAAARGRDEGAEQPVWTGDWVGGQATATRVAAPTLPLGEDPADPRGASLDGIGLRHALIIGVSQSLALFPGVSRSGTTIMAGVASGLTREAATRFSFLLLLPALLGAFTLSLPDLAEPSRFSGVEIAAGVAVSFVSGVLAMRYLIALVARERLTGFARYCILVGALGLFGYVMLGPPSSV